MQEVWTFLVASNVEAMAGCQDWAGGGGFCECYSWEGAKKVKVLGSWPGLLLPKDGSEQLHLNQADMPLMAKEAQQGWRERRNSNEADIPELPRGLTGERE